MFKKTKILFYLPSLNGGGAERVTVNILRLLDEEKYDITLVLVNKIGKYIDLLPSFIQVYDLKMQKTILSVFKLRKLIIQLKPDIIYSTLLRTHITLYFALLNLEKVPKVVLRSPNSPKLLIENNQLTILNKIFLNTAYNKANLVIAQTPEMKEELHLFNHIEKNKIKVFLNPIDTKLIDAKIQNLQNPFREEYINIVAAGRLSEQRGFDILIYSFQQVIHENNNFRLYIIGDGDKREELKNMIKECQMEEYIFFLGFQNNPYKYFYYSDLYVLSSRWEGLPNTILENLYLKKPIIATKCIPYMNHLINDGENGILVDIENINNLANAILSYKIINPKVNTFNFDAQDVNNFFIDLKDRT